MMDGLERLAAGRLAPEELDRRILFHAEPQVMEIDFTGLEFDTSTEVNAF